MNLLQKLQSKKGLSIVEMIIAVAIFTLITSAAFSMYQPINDIAQSVRTDNDASRIISASQEYIERQLRNAVEVEILSEPDWLNDVPSRMETFRRDITRGIDRTGAAHDPRVMMIRGGNLYDVRLNVAFASNPFAVAGDYASFLANPSELEVFRVFNSAFYADVELEYAVDLNQPAPNLQERDKTFLKLKMQAYRGVGANRHIEISASNGGADSANIQLPWIGTFDGVMYDDTTPLNEARFVPGGSGKTSEWAIFYHNNIDIDRAAPIVYDVDRPCQAYCTGVPCSKDNHVVCPGKEKDAPVPCTGNGSCTIIEHAQCPGTLPCWSSECFAPCTPRCYDPFPDDGSTPITTPCGGAGCEFACKATKIKCNCPFGNYTEGGVDKHGCQETEKHCDNIGHGFGCYRKGCGEKWPKDPCISPICCECGVCNNCLKRCERRPNPDGDLIGGCLYQIDKAGTGSCVCCPGCQQPTRELCTCLCKDGCTPDEWVVTNLPTCTESGVKRAITGGVYDVCKAGHPLKSRSEPAPTGHKLGNYIANGAEGHYQSCSNDGCTVSPTMKPHEMRDTGNWYVSGKKTQKCIYCGYTTEESYEPACTGTDDDGNPTGHDFTTPVAGDNPCQEKQQCIHCRWIKTNILSVEEYSDPVTIPATCTMNGSITTSCERCNGKQGGEHKKVEILWAAHLDLTEEIIPNGGSKNCSPHESDRDKVHEKCGECGYEATRPVDRIPHEEFSNWKANTDSTKHIRNCKLCTFEETNTTHEPGTWTSIDNKQCKATCTITGCTHELKEDHELSGGECERCGYKAPTDPTISDSSGSGLGSVNVTVSGTNQIKVTGLPNGAAGERWVEITFPYKIKNVTPTSINGCSIALVGDSQTVLRLTMPNYNAFGGDVTISYERA